MASTTCTSYQEAKSISQQFIKSKGYCSDVCYPYKYDYCMKTYGESKGYYTKCYVDRPAAEWYCTPQAPPSDKCGNNDDCNSNQRCASTPIGNKECFTFTCPSGTQIVNHQCVQQTSNACTNECAYSGLKDCSETGYKTCGNFDSDSCLEFGQVNSCSQGTSCENGECITKCLQGWYGEPYCEDLNNDETLDVVQKFQLSDCKIGSRIKTPCEIGTICDEDSEVCIKEELTSCEDGDSKQDTCPDGTVINIYECKEQSWIETHKTCDGEQTTLNIPLLILIILIFGIISYIMYYYLIKKRR